MFLIAAILSFPACEKNVETLHQPDILNSKPFDLFASGETVSYETIAEFFDDLLAGRIAGLEYIKRNNNFGSLTDPAGNLLDTVVWHVRYELLDELSKPGEVWFFNDEGTYRNGVWYGSERTGLTKVYKLERCQKSGGISVQGFEPIMGFGYGTNIPEIKGWQDSPIIAHILTENDGVVYGFIDNPPGFHSVANFKYGLRMAYAKLSENTMFGGEWGLMDEIGSGMYNNYLSENLSDVMGRAFREVTIDEIQKGYEIQSFYFTSPHEFRIIGK